MRCIYKLHIGLAWHGCVGCQHLELQHNTTEHQPSALKAAGPWILCRCSQTMVSPQLKRKSPHAGLRRQVDKRTCSANSAMNRVSASMGSRRFSRPFRRRVAASAAGLEGVHFEYSLHDCDCTAQLRLSLESVYGASHMLVSMTTTRLAHSAFHLQLELIRCSTKTAACSENAPAAGSRAAAGRAWSRVAARRTWSPGRL